MLQNQVIAPPGQLLTEDEICNALSLTLAGQFTNRRVLVLIPDHTRSLPLPAKDSTRRGSKATGRLSTQ